MYDVMKDLQMETTEGIARVPDRAHTTGQPCVTPSQGSSANRTKSKTRHLNGMI